ncbi:hypothetical protein Tco_0949663, partial [Tanacetum coccineum]
IHLLVNMFNKQKAVGIKSLFDVVWITAAHVCVNAAQLELVLLKDFKEYMLITTASTKLRQPAEVNAASENMQHSYTYNNATPEVGVDTAYAICWIQRIGVSWSRDHARIRRIFLDGYGVLVVRTVIFKIFSFKL